MISYRGSYTVNAFLIVQKEFLIFLEMCMIRLQTYSLASNPLSEVGHSFAEMSQMS